jgi:hypothetical protein
MHLKDLRVPFFRRRNGKDFPDSPYCRYAKVGDLGIHQRISEKKTSPEIPRSEKQSATTFDIESVRPAIGAMASLRRVDIHSALDFPLWCASL